MQLLCVCDFARSFTKWKSSLLALFWHFHNISRLPVTSVNKLWSGHRVLLHVGTREAVRYRDEMLSCGLCGHLLAMEVMLAKFAKSASIRFSSQVPMWAIIPPVPLIWSWLVFAHLRPPSPALHFRTSTCSSLVLAFQIPSTSQATLLSNLTSSLCSAQWPPWLFLQPLSLHSAASRLPPWPSYSQAQLHAHLLSNTIFFQLATNPLFNPSHTGGFFSTPSLTLLPTDTLCNSNFLVSFAPHSLSVLLLVIIFLLSSSLHSPAPCKTKPSSFLLSSRTFTRKTFFEHCKVA